VWPGAHLFEPEGEYETDDAGARDRVKARAKVTGLVLECAEQVGKTERTQVGEKVSEARQRPHQPGAVPFHRQREDRSEVKLHEHGVDHYQSDQQRAPADWDQRGGSHGEDDERKRHDRRRLPQFVGQIATQHVRRRDQQSAQR